MRVLRWPDHRVEELSLPVFLLTLVILTSTNVVLRYVFNSGLTWSDEIYRYCLIFSGFISISYWIHRRSGICADALAQVAPGSVKMIFQVPVQLVVLAFFLPMFKGIIGCWLATKESGQVSDTLQIPMTYVYMAPIIDFGLASLREVQNLVLGFV